MQIWKFQIILINNFFWHGICIIQSVNKLIGHKQQKIDNKTCDNPKHTTLQYNLVLMLNRSSLGKGIKKGRVK